MLKSSGGLEVKESELPVKSRTLARLQCVYIVVSFQTNSLISTCLSNVNTQNTLIKCGDLKSVTQADI